MLPEVNPSTLYDPTTRFEGSQSVSDDGTENPGRLPLPTLSFRVSPHLNEILFFVRPPSHSSVEGRVAGRLLTSK